MISVGLIGCGDVAENGHAPAILQHDCFRLAAVCDVIRPRAELLAARFGGVPIYTDWRKLLANEKLDAAVLALPPEVSPDVVEGCLRRKLAVLDEKPLAATVSQGHRLAQAVDQLGGIFQIGFVLRYGDWVRELGQLAMLLGSPLIIHAEIYDEQFDPKDNAHFDRIQGFLANSSAMTHEGAHIVDYVSLWNPSPWTRVRASAELTSATFAGPNVWNAQIDLADHSTLHIRIGWLLPDLPPSTIRIGGPKGQVHFNCVTGQGSCRVGSEIRSLAMNPLAPEWKRQYDTFAAAIELGHQNVATVWDGLRALEVTAACELSARSGSVVTPADLEPQKDCTVRLEAGHGAAAPQPPIIGRSDRKLLEGLVTERSPD